MVKVKKKRFPTVRIEIIPSRSDNPLSQQSNGGQIPASDPQEVEAERILGIFFSVVIGMIKELKTYARKHKAIGENESFPESMARELREKIVSGMFDWAVRRMGKDLGRYLEEGRQNFLDKFNLILYDPYRGEPRQAKHFREAFERADFLIPLKFSRRIVPHALWPTLWAEYNKALQKAQEIKRKNWKNSAALKMRFKDPGVFPGINDNTAEKFCIMKPSDIAASYVQWKFKLLVGVEALKEYFKVFHRDYPYGYMDFMVRNLAKVKQPHRRNLR